MPTKQMRERESVVSSASTRAIEEATRELLLRVVGEQVAMRVDQLARYLQVPEAVVVELVGAMETEGLLRREELIVGESPWVWLRGAGARLGGMGFFYKQPVLWGVRHRAAVNEVRLWLEGRVPGARWVPERSVRLPGAGRVHVPDGVLEVGDQRYAIEVELTKKSPARVRGVIAGHAARYDAVVYFCGVRTFSWMEGVIGGLSGTPVSLRELPEEHLTAEPDYRGVREEVWPFPGEVPLLAFVVEQGAAPVDQISRYLRLGLSETEVLVESLRERGFVSCVDEIAGEPRWVWLTERGAHCSGTGLARMRVSVGAVERLRTVNEVRLWVRARVPEARWVGRRELVAARAGSGRLVVPKAVVEVGPQRFAMEVPFGARVGKVVPRLARWSEDYDAVVCFVRSGYVARYRRAVAEHGWSDVVIEDAAEVGGAARGAGAYWAPALERELLGVVAEHGLISEEQLARVLCLECAEICEIAAHLEGSGMLGRCGQVWNPDGLLSCTARGMARSGSDLDRYRPPGAVTVLREMEALAAACLSWRDAGEEGEWVTKRRLLKGRGRGSHGLRGEVVRGTGRWAVEVFFAEHRRDRRIVLGRVAKAREGHVGVMVFCAREVLEWVEGLLGEAGDAGLTEVRVLPGGERWARR